MSITEAPGADRCEGSLKRRYRGFLKEKGTRGEGLVNGQERNEVERLGDQETSPREHRGEAGILSEEPLPFPRLSPPLPDGLASCP